MNDWASGKFNDYDGKHYLNRYESELEMKIPQRLVWSILNSIELFSQHPLLAWNLIRRREGHKFFWEIIGGANDVAFHTTNDGWKEVGKMFLNKFV